MDTRQTRHVDGGGLRGWWRFVWMVTVRVDGCGLRGWWRFSLSHFAWMVPVCADGGGLRGWWRSAWMMALFFRRFIFISIPLDCYGL